MASLAELERAIEDDPSDRAHYAVLGDWLMEQGDPRGEWIALERRRPKDAAAIFAANQARFVGPMASWRASELTWRDGFVYAARVVRDDYLERDPPATLRARVEALLTHASGRFVVELAVVHERSDGVSDLREVADWLAARRPRALRRLDLGDPKQVYQHGGDISALWPALDRATRVVLIGDYTLGVIALPGARHVEIKRRTLDRGAVKALERASWPELTRLELGCAERRDAARLASVVGRGDLANLTALALGGALGDAAVEIVAKSPMLPKLRVLALSGSGLTDRGAEWLASRRSLFAHLELLDVSGNELTDDAIAELRGIARNLAVAGQRRPMGASRRAPRRL